MALILDQIVANALDQIGHSTDAQKTSEWNEQFVSYANDAQRDLARHVRKKRTDLLTVTDGKILRSSFPREVLKVSSIVAGATSYGFSAPDSDTILIDGLQNGTVSITYEYMPADMKDGQSQPDIPESLHAAIPLYISYRYYMTRDQSKASMFYDSYVKMKSITTSDIGSSDKFSLLNVFS